MITTFLELRTEIADWLNRSDFTTPQLKNFVTATESDIRNDLETRDSFQLATGTMSGDGFIAPSGYLATRTLVVDEHNFSYLPPELYAQKVDDESTGRWYTVNGDTFSVLGGDGLEYELLYQARFDVLTADGDSNWVLDNAPDVYLWGGCKYGSVFLKDRDGVEMYQRLYMEAVDKLNRMERKSKHGTPLIVRVA